MPLPLGTVTFLFSDIEGSTELVQRLGDARYGDLLADHRRLLRTAFMEHGGQEIEVPGDTFFIAFQRALDAVEAAVEAQLAVRSHRWPDEVAVPVRMGIHTGEPLSTGAGYAGLDVHRAARICAAGHGGQILLSQTTRDLVRNNLPTGVELLDLKEHRLKDLQRPEHLYQVVHRSLPAAFHPLRSLDVFKHNLPIQLTSFVGREDEMETVRRLLREHPLVTLTGPGGSGKTRLALQVTADLLEEFPEGVWLVELRALSEPALVEHTLAVILGMREEPGRPLLTLLTEHLRSKKQLLILDNCEHLVGACAKLAAALLRSCPTLHILATSRQPLGVAGETTFVVPSLALPDLRQMQRVEELAHAEAVRLFVERAILAHPRFTLTDTNARVVAQVVHQLDGIPLAIELAAARANVLSVPQIAARLHDRFRLLTKGTRTAPPQHQTLLATMDWSYELLSEQERVFFSRLSVFAGGFTLEAAEAVCADDGISKAMVLELLTQLVDKSLVIADHLGPEVRYRLLETVRQYAQEKVAAAREVEPVRAAHHGWFLALAERAGPMLYGPDDTWLDRLESDRDNLRAALEWSVRHHETEAALRMAVAMMPFWDVRGYWTEGRQRLDAVLAMDGTGKPALMAAALHAAGQLAQYQGDYERTGTLAAQSLALCRDLGDPRATARALTLLASVHYYHNDYGKAQQLFEEGLEHGRSAGDQRLIASILVSLAAITLHQREYDRAARLARESLEAFRRVGDRRDSAIALNLLGVIASDRADFDGARPLFEESLAIRRALGDRRGIAASLSNLGLVARHQHHYDQAEALYRESLAIRRELGDRHGIGIALAGLGVVAFLRGDARQAAAFLKESLDIRASQKDADGVAECLEGLSRVVVDQVAVARLLGAAETLRGTHTPLAAADNRANDEHTDAVRRRLGDTAFEAAWREGAEMGLDQASDHASRVISRQWER